MKYIKSFNESIKSTSKITFNEFERSHITLPFTLNEVDIIKNNIETSVVLGTKTDIELNNGKWQIYYTDKIFISYYITKYDDEWWTVRRIDYAGRESLYICDQFDELILLLKQLRYDNRKLSNM